MPRRPDEDGDVICHQCRQRDGRNSWTIWLSGEKQGERDSFEEAIRLALDVGAARRRPAWLLGETGYPLEPIGSGAPQRDERGSARRRADLGQLQRVSEGRTWEAA